MDGKAGAAKPRRQAAASRGDRDVNVSAIRREPAGEQLHLPADADGVEPTDGDQEGLAGSVHRA
jgi:hypothetical protein